MITIRRTNAQDPGFIRLVELLNTDLAIRDGATHPLAQFNDISELKYVVLAMSGDTMTLRWKSKECMSPQNTEVKE